MSTGGAEVETMPLESLGRFHPVIRCCTPRLLLLLILIVITSIILISSMVDLPGLYTIRRIGQTPPTPTPLIPFKVPHVSFSSSCFNQSEASIGLLPQLITAWSLSTINECRESFLLMDNIFVVHERRGQLKWDQDFGMKMLRWLGNDTKAMRQARSQKIIFIRNKLTGEESIFNPLRAKRPHPAPKGISDKEFIVRLAKDAAKKCDFCNYTSNTAYDTFGRIQSKHCVTAANAFKLEGYHSLIILRKHDPIHWTYPQVLDAFTVAYKWFNHIHSKNTEYIYPVLTWDLLPKSSGSQIHPHLHTFLKPDGYYGYQHHLYKTSIEYSVQNPGRNFYTDYINIHDKMGLAIKHGAAVAIANMTPRKDNEVIVISETANQDFIKLLYATLRTYLDVMDSYSFSMVVTLPIMEQVPTMHPAMARVVPRGKPQATRSDISSMEIYAASNIDTDLFKFTSKLRASVNKIIRRL